jgi:hypothetical protein
MCNRLVLCIAVAIGLSCHSKHDASEVPRVQSPTNADVSWDGTPLGLDPRLSENAERVLLKGDAAIPMLKQALESPESVVAALVLLTKIRGEPYQVSASHWNGLWVRLFPSGKVEYDPQNLNDIRMRWVQTLFRSNS